jgi:hypothetical protein
MTIFVPSDKLALLMSDEKSLKVSVLTVWKACSPPAQIPTMAKTEKKLLRKKLKTEAIPI